MTNVIRLTSRFVAEHLTFMDTADTLAATIRPVPNDFSIALRLFVHLQCAEDSIRSKSPSRGLGPGCFKKHDGLSDVIASLACWDREYNYPPLEPKMTDNISTACFVLMTILGESVHSSPPRSHPSKRKAETEIVFYWVVIEILRSSAAGDPARLILMLQRNSAAVGEVYRIFDEALLLIHRERLPRASADGGSRRRFSLELRDYLLGGLRLPLCVPSPASRAEARCHGARGDGRTTELGRGPREVCARLGCDATRWTEASGGEGAARAVPAAQEKGEDARERRKPLKRCVGCDKAFYCSRRHAREAWQVHRFVCDLDVL